MSSKVQGFYDGNPGYEWNRLERHRIEYAITMRALAERLPPPPATVLDIGGGPGRYAIALSQMGYRVTLLDLSGAELDFAREQAGKEGVALAGVIHGNALDLAPLPDAHFDAVLLMGPLYHLLRLEERQQAVREARRVLKPGGVMAASFIGRYSVLQDVAPSEPEWIIEHEGRHRQVLETGCLLVDSGNFVDAYLAHPSEVRPLMEGEGLQTMDLLAAEGLIGFLDQRINQLQGEQWEAWVDVTYRICRDPSILGAAAHLLWIGRK